MMLTDKPVIERLEQLVTVNRAGERRLYHAAEQVRNRGLKLLLKSYAQQHTRFADALISLLRQAGYEQTSTATPGAAFGRGLTDIQATMIVQREDRQQLVLNQAASEQAQALATYQQVLAEPLPATVQELVKHQAATLDQMQRQLTLLGEHDDHQVLVRLFDQVDQAEQVMDELAEAGFAADQVYTAPVEAMPVYAKEGRERGRSQRETVLAAVGLGALAGLVLGGILALAHRLYFPEVPGILSSTPAGVTIELLGAGLLIGAIFGAIFGLLIGRDAAEDDAYLYQESLQEGETLVAVMADSGQRAEAERIIGLRHEFEVEPVAS